MANIDKVWDKYKKTKSRELKEQLIEHYAPLVKIVAGRLGIYLNSYLELDDLLGFGVIGLIDAIDKYDYDKKIKFETYASLRIRGAIIDEIRKLDWVPRSIRQKQKEYIRAYERVEAKIGHSPTDSDLRKELNINETEYNKLVHDTNISTLVSIDESELYEFNVEDPTTKNPYQELENKEALEILEREILALTEREQLLIKLYYYEELTLKEISLVLEVSESRVSQIHSKLMLKLRNKLKKYNVVFPL
ncbi:MAG: RNA polymerase subunit sigma [Candidatus Epulonipiscioides saccharophilum]|nr:MAG: RNA polymerase subunit sigma [Epulopiscium sp. AS2M-Bin001]